MRRSKRKAVRRKAQRVVREKLEKILGAPEIMPLWFRWIDAVVAYDVGAETEALLELREAIFAAIGEDISPESLGEVLP